MGSCFPERWLISLAGEHVVLSQLCKDFPSNFQLKLGDTLGCWTERGCPYFLLFMAFPPVDLGIILAGTTFLNRTSQSQIPRLMGDLGIKPLHPQLRRCAPSSPVLPPPLSSPPPAAAIIATAPVHPGIRLLFWSLVFVCFLFIYLAVVCSKCDLGPKPVSSVWTL